MKWAITELGGSSKRVLDLTEADFCAIVKARAGVVTLLNTESKFNLVLENYEEYEHELLSLALNDLLFRRTAWATLQSDIFTMNRRLLNVLSSARQYTDQLRHDISRTFGRASPQVGKLKPFVEQERERSFAYRLMETIRNHAQHQGLPIGGLKYSMGRVEDGASVWVRRTVRPSLDVGGLEADRNVRRDMIRELELADADGDFSLWVREYMDSLRRIHGFVRGLFADDVLAWEGTLRAVIARSHEAFGEELIGLAAVGINNDGAVEQEAQVFADLLQRRRTLVARNRVDGNRAHCYVSGRPPKARS